MRMHFLLCDLTNFLNLSFLDSALINNDNVDVSFYFKLATIALWQVVIVSCIKKMHFLLYILTGFLDLFFSDSALITNSNIDASFYFDSKAKAP